MVTKKTKKPVQKKVVKQTKKTKKPVQKKVVKQTKKVQKPIPKKVNTNKLVNVKSFKSGNQELIFAEKKIILIDPTSSMKKIEIWIGQLKRNIEMSANRIVILNSYNKNSFGKFWQIIYSAKDHKQQFLILDYFFKWFKDRKKGDE